MIICFISFYSWFITGYNRDCKKQIILNIFAKIPLKKIPSEICQSVWHVEVYFIQIEKCVNKKHCKALFQVWVELPPKWSRPHFWQIWSGSCQPFTICCQSVRPNKNYFVKMCRNSTTCKNLKWSACVVYKILLPTICGLRTIENSFQNISTKCI